MKSNAAEVDRGFEAKPCSAERTRTCDHFCFARRSAALSFAARHNASANAAAVAGVGFGVRHDPAEQHGVLRLSSSKVPQHYRIALWTVLQLLHKVSSSALPRCCLRGVDVGQRNANLPTLRSWRKITRERDVRFGWHQHAHPGAHSVAHDAADTAVRRVRR